MFSLHESTRKLLCRAAFFALCLAPTCGVLAWCVLVHRPEYRLAHERAISESLGWRATLGGVSLPRPGMVLYEWLELYDQDTGQLLARVPFVEVTRGEGLLEVRLPSPAIVNFTRLDALAMMFHDQARRAISLPHLRFIAPRLSVHLADGEELLTDVRCHFDADDSGALATLAFRRQTAGSAAAIAEVKIRRQRGPEASETIELLTGTTPLPCRLIASVWPGVAALGRDCHYTGHLMSTARGGHWHTQLDGRLTAIDLDRLVSRQFPHELSGTADLRLARVILSDGRLESAAGTFKAGPGTISRSLVQAAATHLRTPALKEILQAKDGTIDYAQLGLSFELSEQGLTLRGDLPLTKGAILVDGKRVLAGEPAAPGQSVLALVRTLVPHPSVHVPATSATIALTRTLPLPLALPTDPGALQPPRQVRTPSGDETR